MLIFCDLNGLKNLINYPACYKNFVNPTSIDLILTNPQVTFNTAHYSIITTINLDLTY